MVAWSNITAGGSATTWASYGGSDATWAEHASAASFEWTPLGRVTDLWLGIDFVAKVSADAPAKARSERAISIWNVSVVTASDYSGEGAP